MIFLYRLGDFHACFADGRKTILKAGFNRLPLFLKFQACVRLLFLGRTIKGFAPFEYSADPGLL